MGKGPSTMEMTQQTLNSASLFNVCCVISIVDGNDTADIE